MNGVVTLEGKCLDCGSHNVVEVCLVIGCDNEPRAQGKCGKHYQQSWTEPGCRVYRCLGKVQARGLCNKHYLRWYRTGDPHRNNQGKRKVRRVPELQGGVERGSTRTS